MAEIAGSYHLTKFESVSYNTGAAKDNTSSLTSCELSDIYTFHADSTAAYSELTDCNNNGSGGWGVSNATLYTSFTSGTGNRISGTSITSWDCSNLVLLTRFPSVDSNYRFTLTRF